MTGNKILLDMPLGLAYLRVLRQERPAGHAGALFQGGIREGRGLCLDRC